VHTKEVGELVILEDWVIRPGCLSGETAFMDGVALPHPVPERIHDLVDRQALLPNRRELARLRLSRGSLYGGRSSHGKQAGESGERRARQDSAKRPRCPTRRRGPARFGRRPKRDYQSSEISQLSSRPRHTNPEPLHANTAMVKNQRSSASSATRKKHAKKAAVASGEVVENPPVPKQKKPRGKEKARLKAEPKKKVYIPPVRPQAIQPDPLDTLGIAFSISSELLVILRRLGKKDTVTKIRALEELQSDWVLKAKEADDPQLLEELTTVIPVWVRLPPQVPRVCSHQTAV